MPNVVILSAIINVAEKQGLSLNFYLNNTPAVVSYALKVERVWRRRCLLSEWEILQGTTPEPFYFWYYFWAASLFFVSSHGYVQELPRIQISLEGWVIPRQVGSRTWSSLQNLKRANISSFLFRAAIGPGVIKPGSPYVLFRRHDQGMQTFKGYSLWSHWN